MKMRKLLAVFVLTAFTALTLTGCESHAAYTFTIDGFDDTIKVELDTSNGEKLKQDNGKFEITTAEDELISTGIFVLPDKFTQITDGISEMDGVTIIDDIESDDFSYLFHKFEGESHSEWDYLLDLNDTEVGIIIANTISEESAKEAFELLTFEVNPD